MGIYHPHSTRFPYAVFIATLIGILAVIVFCSTVHQGATSSILYFAEKFNMNIHRINTMKTTFIILGFFTAVVSCIIFAVEYLANRDAKGKSDWKNRFGGRTGFLILIPIVSILHILWIVVFCLLAIVTFMTTMFLFLCRKSKVKDFSGCINFSQFEFLLEKDNFQLCGESTLSPICHFLENLHPVLVLTILAAALIIITLICYLIKLATKYGSLQYEKYDELQHNSTDLIKESEKNT